MVKIAIAGGTGELGREVMVGLVATKKHEILVLSRKAVDQTQTLGEGVTLVHADYNSVTQLTEALTGVHTVLSFIAPLTDPEGTAQKNLINASVQTGVKRFAPSEWFSFDLEYFPFMSGKITIRSYLAELNRDRKVLEYCLFHCSGFMDYLGAPHKTVKHLTVLAATFDFENRRAIIVDGSEGSRIAFTAVKDVVAVVVRAVEYEGEWPLIGGIKGDVLTTGDVIALGEKLRGGKFDVETLNATDLKTGIVRNSWVPAIFSPYNLGGEEQAAAFTRFFLGRYMLAFAAEAFAVSDEWNKLLPDHEFTRADEFLAEIWRGKP